MSKFKDLTGQKFGRLTVIERAGTSKDRHALWLCQCECGNTTIVIGRSLTKGYTKSCGCIRNKFDSNSIRYQRLYGIWQGIKDRCYNSKNINFVRYGGRGIQMCNEWNNFNNFVEWSLDNGYNDNLTIDRIDVDGNYEPSNCRWVDMKTQGNNKRNNRYITYNNETHTYSEWEDIRGFPKGTISHRINRSRWSIKKAIETPIRKRNK